MPELSTILASLINMLVTLPARSSSFSSGQHVFGQLHMSKDVQRVTGVYLDWGSWISNKVPTTPSVVLVLKSRAVLIAREPDGWRDVRNQCVVVVSGESELRRYLAHSSLRQSPCEIQPSIPPLEGATPGCHQAGVMLRVSRKILQSMFLARHFVPSGFPEQ